MKKYLLVVLLMTVTLIGNTAVSDDSDVYTNQNGISFTEEEILELRRIGVDSLELESLSQVEKNDLLDFSNQDFMMQRMFIKTSYKKSTSRFDEEVVTPNQEELSNVEALIEVELFQQDESIIMLAAGIPPISEEDNGGGSGGSDVGPTISNINDDESDIKTVEIFAFYNYSTDQMHVRIVVKWLTVPIYRGNDLIAISHVPGEFYVNNDLIYNPSSGSYDQVALFDAEQLYLWTEYDTRYSDPYGNSSLESISYDESSDVVYNTDYISGLVYEQKLIEDDYEFVQTGWNYEIPTGYLIGHRATEITIKLSAKFDLANCSVLIGSFAGSLKHQYLSTSFDLDNMFLTVTSPYISFPPSMFIYSQKYEEAIGVSVGVPID